MNHIFTNCEKLLVELENKLNEIEVNQAQGLESIDVCISICRETNEKLRNLIVNYQFPDTEEEIHFFKRIKPSFTAWEIYYKNLYKLHLKWSTNIPEIQKEELDKTANKITLFYHEYQVFYDYFYGHHSNLDNKYFVRGEPDHRSFPGVCPTYTDREFCTPYDELLATLLAYEKLRVYIQKKLYLLLNGTPAPDSKQFILNWTDTKSDLVELAILIKSKASVNSGKASLNSIIKVLEKGFNISVGDPYKITGNMRMRKKSRSTYLDDATDRVNDYLDKEDT